MREKMSDKAIAIIEKIQNTANQVGEAMNSSRAVNPSTPRIVGAEHEFYPYISGYGVLQRIVALGMPTSEQLMIMGVRRKTGRSMLRPLLLPGRVQDTLRQPSKSVTSQRRIYGIRPRGFQFNHFDFSRVVSFHICGAPHAHFTATIVHYFSFLPSLRALGMARSSSATARHAEGRWAPVLTTPVVSGLVLVDFSQSTPTQRYWTSGNFPLVKCRSGWMTTFIGHHASGQAE
jgi:hypothetical protein